MPRELPKSPTRRVFRQIVRSLQSDPVLREFVKTWRVWDGTDKGPEVTLAQCPAIVLTPTNGAQSGRGPTGYQGPLQIGVRLAVPGTNWDVLADFWWAIQRALYPADDTAATAIHAALAALGVHGEIDFDSALTWGGPSENFTFLVGSGRMTVTLTTHNC